MYNVYLYVYVYMYMCMCIITYITCITSKNIMTSKVHNDEKMLNKLCVIASEGLPLLITLVANAITAIIKLVELICLIN